jgi:hypothetical protein
MLSKSIIKKKASSKKPHKLPDMGSVHHHVKLLQAITSRATITTKDVTRLFQSLQLGGQESLRLGDGAIGHCFAIGIEWDIPSKNDLMGYDLIDW